MNDYFNNLKKKKKQALILYKSRLGLLMNDIENKCLAENIYNYYLKIFKNPYNLTLLFFPFNVIDFTSLNSFVSSVYDVKEALLNIEPYKLDEDLTVFRVVSTEDSINDISKSELISTSESIDEASKFLINNKDAKNTFFEINLYKGNKVLFCPYNFKYDTKNNILKLESNDSQKEILLRKDDYDFAKYLDTSYNIEGISFDVKVFDAKTHEKHI